MSDQEEEDARPSVTADKENGESTTAEAEMRLKEDEQNSPSRMLHRLDMIEETQDDETRRQDEIIANVKPTTELEKALTDVLARKDALIERITGEITKLKSFVQKRKQTYKRKRKEDGAPTRALSAYNLFIKERFEELAKENEKALKSDDAGAELKRVPPSNLVAKTGSEWKELPAEIKAEYEERYVDANTGLVSLVVRVAITDFLFFTTSSFHISEEQRPIASDMKTKWQNTILQTSIPTGNEIKQGTRCSSLRMFCASKLQKPASLPSAVPSPEWLAMVSFAVVVVEIKQSSSL